MTRFSKKFREAPTLVGAEGYAVSHLPNHDAFLGLIQRNPTLADATVIASAVVACQTKPLLSSTRPKTHLSRARRASAAQFKVLCRGSSACQLEAEAPSVAIDPIR